MNTMVETAAPLAAHLSWRRRMRAGLPDAARMLVGAMTAYVLAHLLQLHEAHWAVLSALVTGRAQAGGTARAGLERLFATIAGAALAAAVAAVRAWHVDGAVLLFCVLAPLCLLVTLKPAYRAAPVAALIVMSSGPIAGAGPLGTAILRTTEIALGALASVLVSLVVFPSRARAKAHEHAAAILHRLAEWLRCIAQADGGQGTEKLREDLRAELREMTVLAHTAGWRRKRDGQTVRLLRVLTALHGDVGFLARAVARKPLNVDASCAELALPLRAIARQMDDIGAAATSGGPLPSSAELRAALKNSAAATTLERDPIPAFLLRSIAIALAHVAAALSPDEVPPPDEKSTAPATS